VLLRRLKAEVLSDLPPKVREMVAIDGDRAIEKAAKDEMTAFLATGLTLEDLAKKEGFAELSSARHRLADLKVPWLAEYVSNALESSPKAVVFAHHDSVIQALATRLAEFSPVLITGSVSLADRQAAVERFQSDPRTRLIIGSIGAMGVGHTLTAASHTIFAEMSYVPSELLQAEDRTHRIGQKNSVLIQYPYIPESLDERMMNIVLNKQSIIDCVLKG
jgi:SWI/SNF-related matrix-associated actin-dependent regulator 1 of chromatin subfamily A